MSSNDIGSLPDNELVRETEHFHDRIEDGGEGLAPDFDSLPLHSIQRRHRGWLLQARTRWSQMLPF